MKAKKVSGTRNQNQSLASAVEIKRLCTQLALMISKDATGLKELHEGENYSYIFVKANLISLDNNSQNCKMIFCEGVVVVVVVTIQDSTLFIFHFSL